MPFAQSTSELAELLFRISADESPDQVLDAALLFSQTRDNDDSVLAAARDLWQERAVNYFLRCSGKESLYPNLNEWIRKLVDSGIDGKRIVSVPIGERIFNTFTEAEVFTNWVRENGCTRVYVVAAPFHQIRAFVSVVSWLYRSKSELKVYNRVGYSLSWLAGASHSQGIIREARKDWIYEELNRLDQYHEKGDLLSCAEILQYLNER